MENKTITIKLVRSLLGRSAKQIATAKSLGLTKIGHITVQPDNAQTRGRSPRSATWSR